MYDVRGLPAGILVRISDDREGRALGVRRQEDDCRHLAERLGLEVGTRVYVENNLSASAIAGKDRQEFEDFMADWQRGLFKVPLAYTTSRLTRDNLVAERIIQTARETGISPYYVASPWCDLNTAAGREMYRSLAVRDTGESETIQERVKGEKRQSARMGKWKGGRRLYGFGVVIGQNPSTGKDIRDPYQPIPEEVEVLQEGKRRTLAGDSQFTIVRDWNARGLPTSLGYTWDVGKLKRSLLNESYVEFDASGHPTDCPCLKNPEGNGTRKFHDEWHRAMWAAVFTQAEHEAMSAVFNGRDAFWSNKTGIKARRYLLSGLTVCGRCGGLMRGQGKKDQKGVYHRRYACKPWNAAGERIGCHKVFRIADAVEHFVTEQVLFRFDTPEIAQALAPADNEQRMEAAVQRLAELQTRRERLAREYALNKHDDADYDVMMRAVKTEMAELEAEKKQLMSERAKSLSVPTDGTLRDVWADASLEWRASVIKLIVDRVVIHPGLPGRSRYPDKNGWAFKPESVEIVWLF